jgi:hypothetical protein
VESRQFSSSPVLAGTRFFVTCLCMSERAATLYDVVVLHRRLYKQRTLKNLVDTGTGGRGDSVTNYRVLGTKW